MHWTAKSERISGTTTNIKFFSSLPAGEYYIEEVEADEIEYYPVESLFAGVPADAREWQQPILVCWPKEWTASVTNLIKAKPYHVVHKDVVPSGNIVVMSSVK